jgi:HSP20 family protein
MAIQKWEPRGEIAPIRSMREEMDRMFDEFFHGMGTLRPSWMMRPFAWAPEAGGFVPSVDLKETEDSYVVVAELPGLKKEMIDIAVSEDEVTLKGERKETKEEKGENWHRRESVHGSFQRTISLPGTVNANKAEAKMSDGVLTLTLPKSEEEKKKAVKITVK